MIDKPDNAWVQWVAAIEPTITNDVTGDSIAAHCYLASGSPKKSFQKISIFFD